MKYLKSLAAWVVIACVVVLSISLAQACPRTSIESLSSPPVPGAAFGPTIDEAITLMGGDAEKSLGE